MVSRKEAKITTSQIHGQKGIIAPQIISILLKTVEIIEFTQFKRHTNDPEQTLKTRGATFAISAALREHLFDLTMDGVDLVFSQLVTYPNSLGWHLNKHGRNDGPALNILGY